MPQSQKLRKVILQDPRHVHPFNDRARDLRILNKPLWLHQRDVLAPYVDGEMEIPYEIESTQFETLTGPCVVYRDNLFFDEFYIKVFFEEAKNRGKACRAAFSPADQSFREHALPLSTSYTPASGVYLVDLWYFPDGYASDAEPLIIDLLATEVGYYHVPTYMATEQGDLVYQVPLRALIAIDSWVHIHMADVVFGLFSRGARFEDRANRDLVFKLRLLGTALYEGRQLLTSSAAVQVGKNCVIDPSATITGPTTIGDNCFIGAGAVIDNCIVGDNVNISQGCQMQLSVLCDGTFFPFRASLFMTTAMDNTMVAQNTCLQMCVIGRNTFVGAGSTLTDYNLIPIPIRAMNGDGELRVANRPVLGGCVGHNCRLGSGLVISPARTVESDVILVAKEGHWLIDRNVSYEQSDHHNLRGAELHKQLYPRHGTTESESW
jgi:carbonic anhydrase/acetyltransferase-like protein (isoleucine patch superfamily)